MGGMARLEPQVNFRMPATLKDQLDAAAAINGRSLTAEMVVRLQASFAHQVTALAPEHAALLKRIEKVLVKEEAKRQPAGKPKP